MQLSEAELEAKVLEQKEAMRGVKKEGRAMSER